MGKRFLQLRCQLDKVFDELRRCCAAVSQIVVAFIDDHKSRLVRYDDPLNIVNQLGEGGAAKTPVDDGERCKVVLLGWLPFR